jgi:hypothetical protein
VFACPEPSGPVRHSRAHGGRHRQWCPSNGRRLVITNAQQGEAARPEHAEVRAFPSGCRVGGNRGEGARCRSRTGSPTPPSRTPSNGSRAHGAAEPDSLPLPQFVADLMTMKGVVARSDGRTPSRVSWGYTYPVRGVGQPKRSGTDEAVPPVRAMVSSARRARRPFHHGRSAGGSRRSLRRNDKCCAWVGCPPGRAGGWFVREKEYWALLSRTLRSPPQGGVPTSTPRRSHQVVVLASEELRRLTRSAVGPAGPARDTYLVGDSWRRVPHSGGLDRRADLVRPPSIHREIGPRSRLDLCVQSRTDT